MTPIENLRAAFFLPSAPFCWGFLYLICRDSPESSCSWLQADASLRLLWFYLGTRDKCFAIPLSTEPRSLRGGGNISGRPNGVFISRQDGFGSCQERSWSNLKQLGFGQEASSGSTINLPINVPAWKPIFTPNVEGPFKRMPRGSEPLLQKDNFCQYVNIFSSPCQSRGVCVCVYVCMRVYLHDATAQKRSNQARRTS